MEQSEFLQTRVGGLGGSDAAMIFKLGLGGNLSTTDKQRIAVMLGVIESAYNGYQTPAMQAGHDFEDYLAGKLEVGEREKYLCAELSTKFKTFAHADFYIHSEGIVMECKYSQKSTEDLVVFYEPQLQWYYLLGAEQVKLIHGWGGLKIPEEIEGITEVVIEKDNAVIEILHRGIKRLEEIIDLFGYSAPLVATDENLTPETAQICIALAAAIKEIKSLEEKADEFKVKIRDIMRENEVKKIDNEFFTITYVPEGETRTLDKVRLFKAHPEIKEIDFQKVSKKTDYITIKLK